MPSGDSDLLLVKPLGGTDEEITGVYLPLQFRDDLPAKTTFPEPTTDDLGDFQGSKLLFNASRLSFRNAAGPFRSIGKYSFRPRAYQMVPLIMSLRQDFPIRLLIADDVGIGKTIEALMVVREMLDRGEIKRFAIVCLPHLCEQWQAEILDKFGLEAAIIRSSTVARLERQIAGDQSVFQHFPYQVISIDYIKSEQRKQLFIQECPELVIVDEAHTCARPQGATHSQQQRYHLLHTLSKKPKQNLLLLTATPHSGKSEEFQSLLGLLHPDFENIDIIHSDKNTRERLAKHFVQRRRPDIAKWMGEETPFPERVSFEVPYDLSHEYKELLWDALKFARGLATKQTGTTRQQRLQYWTALALLRGIMSSPRMGISMLKKRMEKEAAEEEVETSINPLIESDFGEEGDNAPSDLIEKAELSTVETSDLNDLAKRLAAFDGSSKDRKALEVAKLVNQWLLDDFNPIIYCRYINTAEYLGSIIKESFASKKDLGIEIVTSVDDDELRKEKVEALGKFKQRILVATDCMSEGINLQEHFTAVIHYDLPWNPNRLEQREGRVDRFGQRKSEVRVAFIYGKDNPIDGIVMKVLLRKAQEIRKTIGISVPFPESNQSVMDAVLNAVLLNPKAAQNYGQMKLDFGEDEAFREAEAKVSKAYQLAEEQEKATRSIFAQNAIKAHEIENDLKEADEVIGSVATVEEFVKDALRHIGGQLETWRKGYRIYLPTLPYSLKSFWNDKEDFAAISFQSPTPEGFRYIGRNHPFVEQLCQIILNNSLDRQSKDKVARVSVIITDTVKTRTTLMELRVRNLISNLRGTEELVAEEMMLWGYRKHPNDRDWLAPEAAKSLLDAVPKGELSPLERRELLDEALEDLRACQPIFEEMGYQRAQHLIEAHDRFREAVGGHRYKVVEPVLPMDVMGIYILLPQVS